MIWEIINWKELKKQFEWPKPIAISVNLAKKVQRGNKIKDIFVGEVVMCQIPDSEIEVTFEVVDIKSTVVYVLYTGTCG